MELLRLGINEKLEVKEIHNNNITAGAGKTHSSGRSAGRNCRNNEKRKYGMQNRLNCGQRFEKGRRENVTQKRRVLKGKKRK
jgi:hypothetical protein